MAPATSYMSGNCDGKCKNINVVYVSGLAKNSKKEQLRTSYTPKRIKSLTFNPYTKRKLSTSYQESTTLRK